MGRAEARFGTLGKSLLMLRLLRGFSQADLAARAGIRPNQVSRYETGQVIPQLEQLGRLLDALAVEVVDFFLFDARVGELAMSVEDVEAANEEVAALLRQVAAREVRMSRRVREAVGRMGRVGEGV